MDIPKIYQYYPSVPLSDLSDLYSVGDNRLNSQKVCTISYLPKMLRIGSQVPLTNRYAFFTDGLTTVDAISWSIKLYTKEALQATPASIVAETKSVAEFLIFFSTDFWDSSGLLFDRLVVTCTASYGGSSVELTMEHILVQLLDYANLTQLNQPPASSGDPEASSYVSDPAITNYIYNTLSDYLTESPLLWNGSPILTTLPTESENLMSIVTGILYETLLTVDNTHPEFTPCIDLSLFGNAEIEAYLNDSTGTVKFDGGYRTGTTLLPLFLVNELGVTITDGTIPAFDSISDTNGIYEMINYQPVRSILDKIRRLFGKDIDAGIPEYLSDKIKASKLRLHDAKDVFSRIYVLSQFPKSCIKLSFMLFKFLFECSKKNNCVECYEKEDAWVTSDLTAIKSYPNFLKSLLSHYYESPDNRISELKDYVLKTHSMIWSDYVYQSTHSRPRILTAYFATKKVTGTGSAKRCQFVRIDDKTLRIDANEIALDTAQQPDFDMILGRQVYLVVETMNCRGQNIICQVRPFEDNITGNTTDNLTLIQGPDSWLPLPATADSDGGEPQFQIVTDIRAIVGSYPCLKNIAGNYDDYINLADSTTTLAGHYNVDYLDKAIVKLQLHPGNMASFTSWTNNLKKGTGNLVIRVQPEVNTKGCFYGNTLTYTTDSGEFLGANDPYLPGAKFRCINKMVFEIFAKKHPFNYLSLFGSTRRLIGRIENYYTTNMLNTDPDVATAREAYYYYHDLDEVEHFFGKFYIIRTLNWSSKTYFISMVEATLFTGYNEGNVHIDYTNYSPRHYIDPDCFAGLLGGLAVNNTADLGFRGFSMIDGSPGESVSHFNGIAGDLRLLRTDFSGLGGELDDPTFDRPRQDQFNNALYDYGWGRVADDSGSPDMYSERYKNDAGEWTIIAHCRNMPDHFDHLHVRGFSGTGYGTINGETIQVINL